MRKIVIVGNLGYIGGAVVHELHRQEPESILIGVDTGYFAHCLMGAPIVPEYNLAMQYMVDVRTMPDEIFQGADSVIYLSAISNDPMGNRFEKQTYAINAHAAFQAAKTAKAYGVKTFVLASSCSIYGAAGDLPKTEEDPINPQTAYARSKIMAEQELQHLADASFAITSLRFATAFGDSDRLRLDLVLNDFVASAFVNQKIEILSNGEPFRPLIHVRDMARAIYWATQRRVNPGQEFLILNTGSNMNNFQIIELAELVKQTLPHTSIVVNPHAGQDCRSYRVDFELFARLAPDYQPQVELVEAIQELIDKFERACFHDDNFRRSNFIRLNVLTSHIRDNYLDQHLFWRT